MKKIASLLIIILLGVAILPMRLQNPATYLRRRTPSLVAKR